MGLESVRYNRLGSPKVRVLAWAVKILVLRSRSLSLPSDHCVPLMHVLLRRLDYERHLPKHLSVRLCVLETWYRESCEGDKDFQKWCEVCSPVGWFVISANHVEPSPKREFLSDGRAHTNDLL